LVYALFFFSSRRRHTRFDCDWSSDVCSSDLITRIGVVGIGTMGSGIAQVAATSGFETVVVDLAPEALARGTGAINASLERLVVRSEERRVGKECRARAATDP